ncbi:MAG: hypothetical protein IPL35_05820 [Sphingobacteriales bacterium]|nr:hypothetical protein [Sphingobacteriales bacterium]
MQAASNEVAAAQTASITCNKRSNQKFMKKILFFLLFFISISNIYGQGSWNGRFYFNLIYKNRIVTTKDFLDRKIKLLSNSLESSRIPLHYDTTYNCFIYDSHSITEYRCFYLQTEKDTVKIIFPGLGEKVIMAKSPIIIQGNLLYDYSSSQIMDFVGNNNSTIISKDLHHIFYFDSPEKEKLVIKKNDFRYLEEIKIEEDE